ncbi:MAG: PRC-barrel domain-containing protein [Candidatus Marsarchaeota archaeon]|jgi:sporulation protein YlmC with PRC-barrel domain|nr:PRC-barrel domain-containing protein [Candidatus Marsarchaeota archaeon]
MVKYIIARQLVGKKVVTNDGYDVGRLVDLEISEVTGKINNLLIEPNLDSEFATKLKAEAGYVRVPYEAIMAVNDYVVADRKNM